MAAAPKHSSGTAVTRPADIRSSACPAPSGRTTTCPVREPDQVAEGQRRHEHGLESEALDRLGSGLLLRESVGAERAGEDQRDPRRVPVVDGEDEAGQRADADGEPLQPAQPLAQDQHAHQHRHQRVDEVAQRRLHHAVVGDAVDVGAPVEGDHHRGDRQQPEDPPVAEQRGELTGPPQHEHQRGQGHQRPEDPVCQQLHRPGRLEQRPVEREATPQQVGRQAVQEALARRRHHASIRTRERAAAIVWHCRGLRLETSGKEPLGPAFAGPSASPLEDPCDCWGR